MKKSVRDILLTSSLLANHEYGGYFTNDERVVECLMDMYFYMLYSLDNDDKKEEYLDEFGKKYHDLNDEQKEIVKNEYIEILKAQEKKKRKIKKRGE